MNRRLNIYIYLYPFAVFQKHVILFDKFFLLLLFFLPLSLLVMVLFDGIKGSAKKTLMVQLYFASTRSPARLLARIPKLMSKLNIKLLFFVCDSNGDDGGACVHTVHILAKYIARTFSAHREREGYSARCSHTNNRKQYDECRVCLCLCVCSTE